MGHVSSFFKLGIFSPKNGMGDPSGLGVHTGCYGSLFSAHALISRKGQKAPGARSEEYAEVRTRFEETINRPSRARISDKTQFPKV